MDSEGRQTGTVTRPNPYALQRTVPRVTELGVVDMAVLLATGK